MTTIALTVASSSATSTSTTRKRAVLTCGRGSLTLPSTSPEARLSELGAEWTQIPRPGDTPMLRRASHRLRKLELDVIFGDELGSKNVEADLDKLEAFAVSDDPISVGYGALEAGFWRLTDIAPTSKRREPGTNRVTRLDATLTFVEAERGESGGWGITATTPPKPTTKPTKKKAKPKPSVRHYTVKRGDTLSRIAAHFYHNANLWPRIARANKLRNANRIYPGQRLVIP